MGLTSSMYTALSGLNASQTVLDIAGNNISNSNTTGFKKSTVSFQNQLYQTLSNGTSPSGSSGGTNPVQIGMGVGTGSIRKDMTAGSTQTTGKNSDVAINGNGFFVLKDALGNITYSRDGSFGLDSSQNLVNTNGDYVLGYPVDSNNSILNTTPTKINIPLGQLSAAKATENASFTGNLSSTESEATTPGYATSQQLIDMTTGNPATSSTLLTNLATADKSGVHVLAVGDVITLDAEKGGEKIVPQPTFTVTGASTSDASSGATLSEYMEWLQGNLALDPTSPQSTAAGVSISNGVITVTGNLGVDNVPSISMSSTNSSVTTPFIFETTTPDDVGGSTTTSFTAYDSLGNPIQVKMTFVHESQDTDNTWRFYAESTDDTDASKFLGTGTLTFDTNGKLINSTGTTISVNRSGTGAADPVTISMDLSQITGYSGNATEVNMDGQDGKAAGTLNDYSISDDGTIVGSFSNGLSQNLGQIVLANFSNPEGLIAQSDNNYIAGPDSGEAVITTPGNSGTGNLIGGALELSNVDITEEFINMVSASTAFNASGKVISTAQTLLEELMNIVR